MSTHKKTFLQKFSLNRTIWLLTLSDVFSWGMLQVITSFVGIYLANKFGDDAVRIVGIGTAAFYMARVLAQIPIGIVTDNIKRDRDDILFLIIGNLFMGFPFLLFPTISSPMAYYALEFIFGLGGAMNLVSWRKLFAANLDEEKAGVSFGIYDTILSISMIFYGIIAGVVASISQQYFDSVMVSMGVLVMLSGVWPLLIFFVKNRKSKNV